MKEYQHYYDGEFGIYSSKGLQKKAVWMFMIIWYVLLVILFVVAPVQQAMQEDDVELAADNLPADVPE